MSEQTYTLAIDGPEFKRQRSLLSELADRAHRGKLYRPQEGDEELLEGLMSLCDAIADEAHDRYGIDCLFEER